MASILGVSVTAIRKRLKKFPPSITRVIDGTETGLWQEQSLPEILWIDLMQVAKKQGFNSIGELVRGRHDAPAWSPKIPENEIADECWFKARQLQNALLPFLTRSPVFVTSAADNESEGVAYYKQILGAEISPRYWRELMARTRERDGGRGDWHQLAIYLPDQLRRKADATPAGPEWIFPLVRQAREETYADKAARSEAIWQAVFAQRDQRDQLASEGCPLAELDRRLRDEIADHAPDLIASTGDQFRDALLKTYQRRLKRHLKGLKLDRRKGKGQGPGNCNGYYRTGEAVAKRRLTKGLEALPWFVKAARFVYLISNRNANSGSVPAAVEFVMQFPKVPTGWPDAYKNKFLKAIELDEMPVFPPDLREEILARRNSYGDLVPRSIAQKIVVNASTVEYYRNPRDWALKNLNAPGSQRRFFNKDTNQREIMQPGDWFGGDDATPGIAVCVPCKDVITPSSQKYGVLLGRFQWLAFHDARTDKILAWDYVVRPRGSYRAEDILNGMGAVVKTHGVPRHGFQFEGGTWNSKLVRHAVGALECEHWRTYSPHQKSIEKVFDKVWTRLAIQFPHADMGRFRAENESNCKRYEACKAGHQDPRRYFPTLDLVTKVFEEETAYHNGHPIKSEQYGNWIPDNLFAGAVKETPLRPYSANMEWVFSPFAVERTVRGMLVGCKVPMFENFSVPFEFGADWLPKYHGKKVRLHFNPRQPKCVAKVVLVETGKALGDAHLVSETAAHIRYILEWGDDNQREVFLARQRVAQAVRRETRGIGAAGRVEYARSEERDGLQKSGILERNSNTPAPANDPQSESGKRLASLAATAQTESRAEKQAGLEKLRLETAHIFGEPDRAARNAELEAESVRLDREYKPTFS